MIGTINPIVYRRNQADDGAKPLSWLAAAFVYTVGSLTGGVVTAVVLAALGSVVTAINGKQVGFILLGLVAIAYGLHELQIAKLPKPEWKQQVPAWWRYSLHPYATAFLFGALLGAGFTTFIPSTSYFLVFVTPLLGGFGVGVAAFVAYSLLRSAVLWPFAAMVDDVSKVEELTRLMDLTKPLVVLFNGFILVAMGTHLLTSALRAND
ncbi:MAG: hypothetical protein KatS3mg053_2273 [Candidatus Roseilinea sp.]|nr:MAG: hypothetical protein KatS3mg053_2273 [Candidatus Roseilinea sp.]